MQTLYTTSPSLDDLDLMAQQIYAALPQELSRHVDDVIIRIEEFPDEDVQNDMALDSPFDLLGLYQGIAIGDKGIGDTPSGIDMIFLYRRPILDYWCETGEDLQHLIRHVLIHEIGHHFGLSDEDMDRIEQAER